MRQIALALILTGSLAISLPAADQQLVNMIMPDAKVLAGINVASARNSPLGTFLLRQASSNSTELQKFIDLTGFNPQTDLDEILVATLGTPAIPDVGGVAATKKLEAAPGTRGLILARGTFNIEKISELAKSDGHQEVKIYNGATLISDPKSGTATAIAFISPQIAAVGDLASVKGAVDRRTQVNTLDPLLTSRSNALSSSEDAWAVSIIPLSTINAGPADPMFQGALGGDLLKKITSTSGGIKFGSQIELSTQLVAMDEKNATALGDVVKFLVGMAAMNGGSGKGAPAAVTSFLQSLSIHADGNVLNVSVSVPEEQVESLINSMQPAAKPGATI
jgi:hypothetical protein